MNKTIIEIRRKRDGKILRDEINDACQTHNIYDGDVLVESDKDYNIGYFEGVGFCSFSEYEELADYEEPPMMKQEPPMIKQETTIKGWVAVDTALGVRRVTFFPNKPVRSILTDVHYWATRWPDNESIQLGSNLFKGLRWEDEPVEAEITIKIKR